MCITYNVHNLMADTKISNVLPSLVHSRSKEIHTYSKYNVFFELIQKSYFLPICYELDRLLASTNKINFIFLHNKS